MTEKATDKPDSITYHAIGPNKEGKRVGYVSIDGLPSLYTVQMYSTPEEAIAAIQKLIRHKNIDSDF